MQFQNSLQFAIDLDFNDPLNDYRDRFYFPKDNKGNDTIYFTGNSLGLQPKSTKNYINQELDDWAKFGVEGHVHAKNPWMPYHEFVAEKLAKVVGALPTEVVAMNSLTVNLHLMMVSFYRPLGKKRKIIIANNEFPSDIYAVKSQLKFHNFSDDDLIIAKAKDGKDIISTDEIIKIINENKDEIALLMFAGVNYYTGQYFDIKRITEECHNHDIIAGFDLAHAAGNVPVKLHDWNVDFAVWCSYKYLNSGPGGIAGAFVHQRHKDFKGNRFEGWWGTNKENRFLMKPDFEPISGVEAWQLSNPPIFQLAALNASLDIFEEVGINNLRVKSEKLTGFLEFLLNNLPKDIISVITPKEAAQRGCQLSIKIKDGKKIFNILTEKGVVADWREPDIIRVAPVPLYNSYEDVFKFYQILKDEI